MSNTLKAYVTIVIFTLLSIFGLSSCFGPEAGLSNFAIPTRDSQELKQEFVFRTMQECKAGLSETRRTILASQIVRVANKYFATREERESFVFLICIESKFEDQSKSKVGAVGLTQVMPQFASGFAQACGLGVIASKDLQDAEVNLNLGGCWFASLIKYHHSIALALAAYNSGRDSDSVKKLQALANINNETANYVAKYTILKGRMDAPVSEGQK